MDPLAFRLKNLEDERMRAVLQAAAERFGWGKRPASGHGVGIACGFDKGGYIAACAEVAADRASGGTVKITRVVAAFDCGAVVNPAGLRAQISGALVQGIGGALFEAVEFDDGVVRNARLAQYRVPRFSDTPPIDVDAGGSKGSAVDGRGRGADHRARAGGRRGDLRCDWRAATLVADGARWVEGGDDVARVRATLAPRPLVCSIVPVAQQLDLKATADALGAERVAFAAAPLAERTTGYVLGGISPLGQRKQLRTLVNASALDWAEIFVSAGRRGLELALAPADLLRLTSGTTAAIAR